MKSRNFSWMGIIMVLVCALVGIADGSAIGLHGAEAVVVDGGGAGKTITRDPLLTDVTRVESPDLILDTIDQRITKMRPSATPLDQIMRHATAKTTKTMEFGYYATDIRPIKATVTTKHDIVSTADTADLTVDNGDLFDTTDTIYVPSVNGYNEAGVAEPTQALVLYVRSTGASNVITVQAVNGPLRTGGAEGMAVPNIPANTVIYRMARAAAEGDVRTSPYSALPTKKMNYCQIFKCEVAESSLQALAFSQTEVPWTPSDIEEQAVYEWRLGMEASYLFGQKRKIYDNLKKSYVYTTGGVVSNITKKVDLPATVINADLVDLTKDIFVGNSGSKRRLFFAGSGLVAQLSKISSVEKQLEAGNTVVVWGIEWKEIKTNFGSLLLLQHDILDLYGWENKGLVIDPACLDKYTVEGVKRTELDTKKPGTFDGNVAVITEIAGLALKYPACHAVVDGSAGA